VPVALTIRPIDARRRSLPVRCRIAVRRDTALLQTADVEPGHSAARFAGLALHQVYIATVLPDLFKASAQFVPVAATDVDQTVLCLVHPRHAEPQLPLYASLDAELQVVLERSDTLDRPKEARATPRRENEERPLEARAVGFGRTMPARSAREVRLGESRWNKLCAEQRAGLLNLFAMMRSVGVTKGGTVWAYVQTLEEVERDRVHVIVEPALNELVHSTSCFDTAGGFLHHAKPGYQRMQSFKTREPFGNLQLTFFRRDGDDVPTTVDADVDDAAGVEHAEQVARNITTAIVKRALRALFPDLPEGKTHPYDIHQLLIHYQVKTTEPSGNIVPYAPCYVLRVPSAPMPYAI
jgi:hypothetical protein